MVEWSIFSVVDGNNSTDGKEVLRWCGVTGAPSVVTSNGSALFIHFHTDELVEARGFNVSFEKFGPS